MKSQLTWDRTLFCYRKPKVTFNSRDGNNPMKPKGFEWFI